jgi:hypothetical protein
MNRDSLLSVRRVERLNFTYAPWSWDFADRRRQEIDVFFSDERKENPSLWNGQLLLFARRLSWQAKGPWRRLTRAGSLWFASYRAVRGASTRPLAQR